MSDLTTLSQRRWPWLLPLLAAIIPLWMTFSHTTLMPRADQWGVVAVPFLAWQDGQPFWSVLHDQFNDSRHDAPKFLHLLIAKYAGWNQTLEALVCTFIGITTGALLIWLIRKKQPAGPAGSLLCAFVCAFLWLNAGQCMNWTWGVQICYQLMVCGGVATVAILHTDWPVIARVIAASVTAFIAAHSFSAGWLAWGMGGACLLWFALFQKPRPARSWIAILLWAAALGFTAWVFFSGYQYKNEAQHEALVRSPADFARYLLMLIGAPLGRSWIIGNREWENRISFAFSSTVGALALVLFGALLIAGVLRHWRGRGGSALPFALLGLFGLAASFAITLARTGSVGDPFQSRYQALTLWLHIAIVVLLGFTSGTFWTWTRRVWIALVIHGCLTNTWNGMDRARRDYDEDRIVGAGHAMRLVAPEPVLLDLVVPGMNVETSFPMLEKMDAHGCFQIRTLASDLVSAANLSQTHAQGAITRSQLTGGIPVIECWAIYNDSRDSTDAVAISIQTEGEPERWFGLAQKRARLNKLSDKLDSTALFNRIGWTYTYPAIAGENIYGHTVQFQPKPLPQTPYTLRAYAFDVRKNLFTRLEGEAKF